MIRLAAAPAPDGIVETGPVGGLVVVVGGGVQATSPPSASVNKTSVDAKRIGDGRGIGGMKPLSERPPDRLTTLCDIWPLSSGTQRHQQGVPKLHG